VNVCIDVIRRRGAMRSDSVEFDERIGHDLAEANLGAVSSQLGSNPESRCSSARWREIQAALGADPGEAPAILLLRELDGLSYEELAQVLEIPKGTVMSRLFHARAKVQKLLAESLGIPLPAEGGTLMAKGQNEPGACVRGRKGRLSCR
jgi:RNA polymerase sigma-70 factor (ECF subfamily)